MTADEFKKYFRQYLALVVSQIFPASGFLSLAKEERFQIDIKPNMNSPEQIKVRVIRSRKMVLTESENVSPLHVDFYLRRISQDYDVRFREVAREDELFAGFELPDPQVQEVISNLCLKSWRIVSIHVEVKPFNGKDEVPLRLDVAHKRLRPFIDHLRIKDPECAKLHGESIEVISESEWGQIAGT